MPLFLSIFWICVKEFAGSSAEPFRRGERSSREPPGSSRAGEAARAAASPLPREPRPCPGGEGNPQRCAAPAGAAALDQFAGLEVHGYKLVHIFKGSRSCRCRSVSHGARARVSMRAALRFFCLTVETCSAAVCGRWLFSTSLCAHQSRVVGCVSYRVKVGCL